MYLFLLIKYFSTQSCLSKEKEVARLINFTIRLEELGRVFRNTFFDSVSVCLEHIIWSSASFYEYNGYDWLDKPTLELPILRSLYVICLTLTMFDDYELSLASVNQGFKDLITTLTKERLVLKSYVLMLQWHKL